jgi:hypothetical protein
MRIDAAQREVRTVFRGGFVGQLVSSSLWLVAAALGTWSTPRNAIVALCLGGILIFPVTMGILRATGRPAMLGRENPMGQLARQVAFTVPLNLPVVGAAALYRLEWFFPAFMIVLGSHYLPFAFLYGMWQFQILGGFLVASGLMLGLYGPRTFSLGGWITGVALLVFAFAGRAIAERE